MRIRSDRDGLATLKEADMQGAILPLLNVAISLIEKTVEMIPKVREALASNELTPEMKEQLEGRVREAQNKLTKWE